MCSCTVDDGLNVCNTYNSAGSSFGQFAHIPVKKTLQMVVSSKQIACTLWKCEFGFAAYCYNISSNIFYLHYTDHWNEIKVLNAHDLTTDSISDIWTAGGIEQNTNCFSIKGNLGLSIFTDGVPLFKYSSISFWVSICRDSKFTPFNSL